MSTHQWILFIVSAADCPACIRQKPTWLKLKQDIATKIGKRLIIEDIEFEKRTTSDIDTKKYPLSIARYISWFPTFIMINKDHYDKVKSTPSTPLEAFVFNGKKQDDPMLRVETVGKDKSKPPTQENLINWIEQCMNNKLLSEEEQQQQRPIPPLVRQPQPPVVVPTVQTCGRYKLKSKYK